MQQNIGVKRWENTVTYTVVAAVWRRPISASNTNAQCSSLRPQHPQNQLLIHLQITLVCARRVLYDGLWGQRSRHGRLGCGDGCRRQQPSLFWGVSFINVFVVKYIVGVRSSVHSCQLLCVILQHIAYILFSVNLPTFSSPPCLEHLRTCALILLRLWLVLY